MATAEGRFLESPGVLLPPVPTIWRAIVRQRWVIVISGVFALLRLPSFVEPTWYSDAGTYADIGWALNHGARLYIEVWDNKPPGMYWLSEFLIAHFPTAIAMPLASSLFTATAAFCVAAAGSRLGGAQVGNAAALVYVVIGSLPSLDGNLFNAELCGAAFVAMAVAIVLRASSFRWLILAGTLVGVAALFKAVFAADIVMVIAIPAIVRLSEKRRMLSTPNAKAALAILAGCSVTMIAAALALLRQDALGPAIAVIARSDVSYIVTYGSGGISGVPGTLLTALRIFIVLVAGVGIARALIRRGHPSAAVLAWWLGWDLASAMVSARGFPHYVQQAEPVLCLALALAAFALSSRFGHRRLLVATTVLATFICCQVVLWLPSAEIAVASGHGLPGPKDDGVATSRLPAYYIDGYRRLIDPSAGQAFDASFPTDLAQQRMAVKIVDSLSAPGDRVFVWGWISWVYALSNRMPAGRYVALDSAYYVDPSAQSNLLGDLEAHPPKVLIVETKATPQALVDFLLQHRYQRVVTAVGGSDYWVLS